VKIGVIGAGWLGGTVAEAWVRAGHEVMFSSRHPGKHADVARRVGPTASAGSTRQAAEHGDVMLIAVPYRALAAVGEDLADVLVGKIVIDACNPYPGADPAELIREGEAEGVALASAGRLPGTRYVRCFSSVDATEIEASSEGRRREPLAVPLVSDDLQARELVADLVRDAGCVPVIVGGLADGRGFQRGGPAFRLHVGEVELRRRLGL
jgi:predicted dinucleotide-binding enzyme